MLFIRDLEGLHWYSDTDEGFGVYYSGELNALVTIDIDEMMVLELEKLGGI